MSGVRQAPTLSRELGGILGGRWYLICIAATVALCSFAGRALASPASIPPIVLESNVGERPPNMDQLIAPLLDALAGYGFEVKPATIAKLLGPHAPRPGILDRGKTAREIAQQIETGLDAFRTGKFKDAEDALSVAVQLIKRNPGLWVLDGSNANLTYSAFVKLAVAQAQNGRAEESFATMMDLLRMSSTPISQSNYGPRAEKLFKGAQKLAQTMGRGTLIANVSDNHAVIFIDGAFRGIGKVAVGDLLPGPRHIFVQVGTEGRQYEIEVRPNDESSINIDWQIDSVLTIGEPSAGFTFANEQERANEGMYARQLARQWGAEKVIVVGLTRLEGNLQVVGTVYPADAPAARRASVPLSEGAVGMRSLARFLFDGTSNGNLNVIERGQGTYTSSAPVAPSGNLTLTSGLVLGVGGIAVAGGIGTYIVSKPDDHTAPTYDDYKSPAVDVVVASSPVLGAGIYLTLRDTTTAGRLTSALLAAGATSLVLGSFLYLTDEDEDMRTTGYVRKTYRDSAEHGVIIGGSGVLLTGLGAWLWHRERDRLSLSASASGRISEGANTRASFVPVVSVAPSLVLVSCTGSF
jgi:hypothetical protein